MIELRIERYETGWDKNWQHTENGVSIEAHAPSKIVLRAARGGTLSIQAGVRHGGRPAARPFINGVETAYEEPQERSVRQGEELLLEAHLEGNRDQCWNFWSIESAQIKAPPLVKVSFWKNAHLGDSLGILIAAENFARENNCVMEIGSTALFRDITEVFHFSRISLVPGTPEMIHIHPFGHDLDTLGWCGGIAKAIRLRVGGEMPRSIVLPELGFQPAKSVEDVVLVQFDGRSGGVWSRATILRLLEGYRSSPIAVVGGPDTSRYLGDEAEYRLGNLRYIADQLLSCRRFVGADSGLAHLACVLGIDTDVFPSPAVNPEFVRGIFSFYPRPPRLRRVGEARRSQTVRRGALLVSTTSGWNPGDDFIRQGVMRLLKTGSTDPVIWLNRSQMRVPDAQRKCHWTPSWRLLANFGDPRHLVENARALVVAGTPEWIDTIQPFYQLAVACGLPIWIIGAGGGQEGQVHHLSEPIRHGLLTVATVRDETARRALALAGHASERFMDPAFHADPSYSPTGQDLFVFNPRLQCKEHRALYRELYRKLKDQIDVITVHEQDEFTHARDLFDKPVIFNSDYRAYLEIYRACAIYVGGRMHGAIPSLASGAECHLVCHETKHFECEWLLDRLNNPEALNLVSPDDAITVRPSKVRFDQSATIQEDFESHQRHLFDRIDAEERRTSHTDNETGIVTSS